MGSNPIETSRQAEVSKNVSTASGDDSADTPGLRVSGRRKEKKGEGHYLEGPLSDYLEGGPIIGRVPDERSLGLDSLV